MRQNYDPKVLLPLKGDTGAFFSNCNKTENAKLAKRKFYLKIWTNILRNIFFPFFEICDNDALSVCGWRFYFFKPPIWYLFNVKSILWLRATCSRHVPSSTEKEPSKLVFPKNSKKNFLVIAHGRLAIERNSFIHKYVNQFGTKSLR